MGQGSTNQRVIAIYMSAEERQKELAHMDWQAKQIRELRLMLSERMVPDETESQAKARRNWHLYETMRDIAAARAQEIERLRKDNAVLRSMLSWLPGFQARVNACAHRDQRAARALV